MSAILALLEARKAGATVLVRNGKLVVQSAGRLPDGIRENLRINRDTLVRYLTRGPSTHAEWDAEYERLGGEIDSLHDQARAARVIGDVEKAEQLGHQCRELVEGPYRNAREQSLAAAATTNEAAA